MMDAITTLLDEMIADPRHGWSIGTFGAVGEFARDDDEPATIERHGEARSVVTARGGIRVTPRGDLCIVAYDTLSSDGETWGQSVAICMPAPATMAQGAVRAIGPDGDALRPEDRDAMLFDTGAGLGHVRFCLRTRDPALIAALTALAGGSLFGADGAAAMTEVLHAQPHRVLLSPVGRVEVYSPIPFPGGSSPEGPHTHLLPKLLASGRTHAANAPIPDALQPVLMLHPRSPWRDGMGRRIDFDAELDDIFEDIVARFGRREDLEVRAAVEDAIGAGVAPEAFAWPESRRARIAARIALRRLARRNRGAVEAWRRRYDRTNEAEDGAEDGAGNEAEAALHA